MIANCSTMPIKILLDADSCPVKDIAINVARGFSLQVVLVASVAHQMNSINDHVRVVTVDNAPQAVDMQIMNMIQNGDIVVTGDFGLASLVLAKGAKAISPRGMVFHSSNIDRLLLQRHIDAKIRRGGGKTKGPSPMKREDKERFAKEFQSVIEETLQENIK